MKSKSSRLFPPKFQPQALSHVAFLLRSPALERSDGGYQSRRQSRVSFLSIAASMLLSILQNAPPFSNSMRYRLSIISWGLLDFERGSMGAISSSDACNAASLISKRLSSAGISD